MNKNLQIVICMLITICWSINDMRAQERSYTGTITIEPIRLEQQGNVVHVDLNFILEDVKVKSPRGVDFIPQLVTPTVTYNLPMIAFKGQNEYLAYERRLSVMSTKEKKEYKKPYRVEKVNKRVDDTLQYRYVLPYEPWMEEAELWIQRDECGCGQTELMNHVSLVDRITLEQILLPYTVSPHLAYVEPMIEKVKNRNVQVECFLDFEVNKVNIRPEYMNNPKELAKIRSMIDELKSDSGIIVKRLDITGYASPEGTLAVNKRLSEGRAMALRDYLASRYDFQRNLYHIVFGGENWEGLVKALDTIDMEYKNEVLEIIGNVSIEQGRETRLMQLHGGIPYRYMLRNIFPDLRVAVCNVAYEVKNFSVDEAKDVIKIRPQNLSLNEMFLVANSYPVGSQEFIDVFETAVRIYPESEIANMNAAAAALLRNDWVTAERYLQKVKPEVYLSEYNNAMGVLTLLKGDYDVSEKHLKTSAELGLQAARDNLEEWVRKKTNVAEIEKRKRSIKMSDE